MKQTTRFDRQVTLVFIATIIVIMATTYFTFNKVVREHINQQHQAIVPLLTLVTNEIVRPLSVSHYMANDYFVLTLSESDTIEQNTLTNYLKSVSENYGYVTFIALEKHDFMLDSTGKRISLNNDKAEWYHRLKNQEQDQFADIGNLEDPHLYFDIKLKNKANEFLGFVGVAVDLDYFANNFKHYRDKYGVELFVADQYNNVTLSSDALMKTDRHHRKDATVNLSSLPWFNAFSTLESANKVSQMVDTNEQQFVVSKLAIPELNWHLYIVAPPTNQQSGYWQLFAGQLVIVLFVSLLLYLAFERIVHMFKSSVVKNSETDFLTQLPNRSFINWKIEDIRDQYQSVSIVIADIDKFKLINDKYGHLVGDDVLKGVAKKLALSLRKIDIIGRWGGEEFIMILPETTCHQAKEITERIRANIEAAPIAAASTSEIINVTVSFGISQGSLTAESLNDIIQKADQALYQAKTNGRNQVITYNQAV